ncbi:hypothetical protein J7L05_10555 [bacterium]|nr:hypothetical protein [bacterium]
MKRYLGKFKRCRRTLLEHCPADEIIGLSRKESMRIYASRIPHGEFVVLKITNSRSE